MARDEESLVTIGFPASAQISELAGEVRKPMLYPLSYEGRGTRAGAVENLVENLQRRLGPRPTMVSVGPAVAPNGALHGMGSGDGQLDVLFAGQPAGLPLASA